VSPRWNEVVERVQRDGAYRRLWQENPAQAAALLDLDEEAQAFATRAALVAGCPAFANIPPVELATLAAKGSIDTHVTGTTIVRQGAEEDSFYFILDGEVAITVADQMGHRHVVAALKPGDYFGEVALLFDTTRIADAQAVTPCTLLSLQRDDFYRVLEAAPTMRRDVEATAMRRLRQPFPGPTAVNGTLAATTA
jgi:signal-transduction protein with cAMP-binding, CBS, and nucleotidyltransferase domain